MIDLDRQLRELFKKERMLAFFDFRVSLGGAEPLSGLCKISQPKGGSPQPQYLSLLFLIDTPNATDWQQVGDYTGHLNWDAFLRELPGVETVLPLPHLHRGTGIYFKEVDIYLNSAEQITKPYVLSKLYPAILRVMKLTGGEVVFWDDVPESKLELQGLALGKEGGRSVVARLKDFFGIYTS